MKTATTGRTSQHSIVQGRNFGLKSGGTNSEGERSALKSGGTVLLSPESGGTGTPVNYAYSIVTD